MGVRFWREMEQILGSMSGVEMVVVNQRVIMIRVTTDHNIMSE